MDLSNYLVIRDDIKVALKNKQPVVALESTIISHGFNYPENLETALRCEEIIRDHGAIPATIGIRDGKIIIGLTQDDIVYFAENRTIPKCSRRDVATILALKKDGATTVATTMMFANMAKIKLFATGGIGGVHIHGETTMDISADLEELATTDVNVVCAGAKSILDLEKTMEYLETKGVPVLGYQTSAFPDFYTRDSGLKVDYRVDSAKEVAKIIKTKEYLGLKGGLLITNPIPEEAELNPAFIRKEIALANQQAAEQGIKGKEVTPYLLAFLHDSTAGKSVAANKALVYNNCKVAAKIARALTRLEMEREL